MKLNELAGLANKLPQNPGLNASGEYFVSVVVLLLVPIDGEYHILFEKRAPSIRQGGEISLPGGEFDESDGTLEMAALREVEEEVGIPRSKIKIIGRLDSVIVPLGVMVNVFVGVSDVSESEITANPKEVEKAFLIPVSHFQHNQPETYELMTRIYPSFTDAKTNDEVVLLPSKELGLPERYWKSWGGARHKVYVFKTSEGTIWGIDRKSVV